MATLTKTREEQSDAAQTRQAIPATSGYSRSEPRILTEDFMHQLALANRERRAQRCPWLEDNLARLSEINPTVLANPRKPYGMSHSAK